MSGRAPSAGSLPKGRWSFRVEAHSAAPPPDLWPLIGEAGRWKEWSFLDRSDLVRTGEPDPDGVGAIRRFTRFGIGSREEVVMWEPPHHLGYVIVKGFPVRHYRADVVLEPAGTGTLLTWSATFDALIPGTGHAMVILLRSFISRFATGVARYADQTAGSGT
jgi:hypothetical protein